MDGAKCANSRTQFSNVEDLQTGEEAWMGVNGVWKLQDSRNNNEMRPFVPALPQVREETDDLGSLS